MRTVYKYKLQLTDFQAIVMPKDAKILTVQTQGDDFVLWAFVETSNPIERRVFSVVGTGNDAEHVNLDKGDKYLSTVQTGPFVWHIFEVV